MQMQQSFSGLLNIHNDPRVVRGSTTRTLQQLAEENKRKKTSRKKTSSISHASAVLPQLSSSLPYYQYKTSSYVNKNLDLTSFLVEAEADIHTKDNNTQTVGMFPPISHIEYKPLKNGVDSSTAIVDQAELFNFDEEVQPMLDVIISKTLEQSLLELAQEAEIGSIHRGVNEERKSKRLDAEETAKIASLDQQSTRNKIKAINVCTEEKKNRDELLHKVACRRLGREMTEIIQKRAISGLEAQFIEWRSFEEQQAFEMINSYIIPKVSESIDLRERIGQLLDSMIAESSKTASSSIQTVRPRKASVVNLHISKAITGTEEDINIGPILLDPGDSIEVAEDKIMQEIIRLGYGDKIRPSKGFLSDYCIHGNLSSQSSTISDIATSKSTEINVSLT